MGVRERPQRGGLTRERAAGSGISNGGVGGGKVSSKEGAIPVTFALSPSVKMSVHWGPLAVPAQCASSSFGTSTTCKAKASAPSPHNGGQQGVKTVVLGWCVSCEKKGLGPIRSTT